MLLNIVSNKIYLISKNNLDHCHYFAKDGCIESKDLPKNRTQCHQSGLAPRPLNPEMSALTMWPLQQGGNDSLQAYFIEKMAVMLSEHEPTSIASFYAA